MALWALAADFQFDSYAAWSSLDPSGMTTRLMDMLTCWDWIVDSAVKAGAEHFALLGDVFNSRVSVDLTVLDGVSRHMADASKRLNLWVIPGNHDSYLRDSRINSVQVMRGYATVFDAPTVANTSHGYRMGLVPWTEKESDLRCGVEKVLSDGADVLLTHALIEGVAGGSSGMPLAALQPSRFKQVFLGDVHDPIQVADNVRYVGSPMQIDYRDAGRWRGYTLFDDESGKITPVENLTSPRFHVVKVPEDIDNVGVDDFVRMSCDPEDAAVMAEAAREITPHVENRYAPIEEGLKPRLAVRSGQDHREVLERYVRFILPDESDDRVNCLVEVGMQLLEQARV